MFRSLQACTKSASIHYNSGSNQIMKTILTGITKLNTTTNTITTQQLSPADHFHVGGAASAKHLFNHLSLPTAASDNTVNILDVGCGLGGPARQLSSKTENYHVTGIDITKEYIAVASELSSFTDNKRTEFFVGDITDTEDCRLIYDEAFDSAYMIHVGMNIPDKDLLANQLQRILKPGGRFGVYDICLAEGCDLIEDIDFIKREGIRLPLPFSSTVEGLEGLSKGSTYDNIFQNSGFKLILNEDKKEYTLQFLKRLVDGFEKNDSEDDDGEKKKLHPFGPWITMGSNYQEKIVNLKQFIESDIGSARFMVWEKL